MGRTRPFPIGNLDSVGVVKSLPADRIPDGGWQTLTNMRLFDGKLSSIEGYEKFVSVALDSRVMHGTQFVKDNGDKFIIAISKRKLYSYDNVDTFITKQDGTEFTGTDSELFTTTVGFDLLMVANLADVIRKWDGVTSTIDVLGGLTDAEPGGVSAKAKIIRAFNDFIILYHTAEGGDAKPRRVRWSKKGFPEIWKNEPSGAGQAGFTDLTDSPDFVVNAIQLNDYMAIYKERSIYLQQYVGLPVIFSFRKVVTNKGLGAQRAVVNVGDRHIFMSDDNFYSFSGTTPQPIGDAIKTFFYNDLNPAFKHLVHAVLREEVNEVWFHYADVTVTDGASNKTAIYNYRTGTWSFATYTATTWFRAESTSGSAWDTMPDETWDDTVGTWDARSLTGNNPIDLFGDDSGNIHRVGLNNSFDGSDYVKQAISKHYDFGLPHISKRLHKVFIGADVTSDTPISVRVGHVQNVGDPIVWTDTKVIILSAGGTIEVTIDITDVYFIFEFTTSLKNQPFSLLNMIPWFIRREVRT